MTSERPTGLTRDAGWQIGARRTLPIESGAAWRWLTSTEGLGIWLGRSADLNLEEGAAYQLADGTAGELRVVAPESHLRLTWQPVDWPRASTLQVRVVPKGERTVIAFHQEHLPNSRSREERRRFFHAVLDQLEARFDTTG